MTAINDGCRADKRKARELLAAAPTITPDAELRQAARNLLKRRMSNTIPSAALADAWAEARAWDRFALALDAAEDAARDGAR